MKVTEELLRELVLFINIFIRKLEKLKNTLATECMVCHVRSSSPDSRNEHRAGSDPCEERPLLYSLCSLGLQGIRCCFRTRSLNPITSSSLNLKLMETQKTILSYQSLTGNLQIPNEMELK